MTSGTHTLFDSVFNNTHSELLSLREQMKEFQTIYQSNVTIPFTNNESCLIEPILIEPILIEPSLNDESNLNEPILNDEQINKFKTIYSKNKIEDIDEDNDDDSTQKLKKKLNKKDEEAQFKKLQTVYCCKKKCLQDLVLHENAVTNYHKFQDLNNNQKDMFLFGILTATARNETTTKGQKRSRLANNYIFEGIYICNVAFLIIYGIGEKYWRNVRTHFIEQGISPRIHQLIEKVSNFAISFEKILEILSFITNYANVHGLPSPGI